MALSYRIENGILHVHVSGEPSIGEVAAFSATWLADPALPSPVLTCWDLREEAYREPDHVRALARVSRDIPVPPGSRLAILASEDVAYGLSRMYEAYADGRHYDVAVFRSMDDAETWLLEPGARPLP